MKVIVSSLSAILYYNFVSLHLIIILSNRAISYLLNTRFRSQKSKPKSLWTERHRELYQSNIKLIPNPKNGNPALINYYIKPLSSIVMKNCTILEIKAVLGLKFVNVADIISIRTAGKHSLINLVNKSTFEAFHSIGWFEKVLPTPDFCRCHRSYIVNCRYVDCLNLTQNKVHLVNDYDAIPLAREKKQNIQNNIIQCFEAD